MRKILIFLSIISFELTSFGMFRRTVHLPKGDIYNQQEVISEAFLKHSPQCVKDVDKFWWVFYNQYEGKSPSTLNITKLSSRARIQLFKKIISHKISKLSSRLSSKGYWNKYGEDRYPTEFQVGNMIFQVMSVFSQEQPGNIIIGSCHLNANCCQRRTWEDIFKEISSIPENSLRDDPKYKQLKIEFYFMLDFEVARRLVNGDRYADLPIITYVPYLREHYRQCEDFIVGKKSKYHATQSLFTGDDRPVIAQTLTRQIGFTSPEAIRRSLDCLCGDDEQSDYEYIQ